MDIKTKFNVGDTVWYQKLDRKSNGFIPEERKIKSIQIVVNDDSNIDILYHFDCPFWEGLLYATKEECQKACDQKYIYLPE